MTVYRSIIRLVRSGRTYCRIDTPTFTYHLIQRNDLFIVIRIIILLRTLTFWNKIDIKLERNDVSIISIFCYFYAQFPN